MIRRYRPGCSASLRAGLLVMAASLSGCSLFVPRTPEPVEPLPPPPPPIVEPVATHTFPFDPETTGAIGLLQVTHARHEDTLPDLARRFNLGFDRFQDPSIA